MKLATKKFKQMRYWNGRTYFDMLHSKFQGYICAFSKAEAVRVGKQLWQNFTIKELNDYWSECWGDAATDILGTEQTEPAVFVILNEGFEGKHVFKYEGTYNPRRA